MRSSTTPTWSNHAIEEPPSSQGIPDVFEEKRSSSRDNVDVGHMHTFSFSSPTTFLVTHGHSSPGTQMHQDEYEVPLLNDSGACLPQRRMHQQEELVDDECSFELELPDNGDARSEVSDISMDEDWIEHELGFFQVPPSYSFMETDSLDTNAEDELLATIDLMLAMTKTKKAPASNFEPSGRDQTLPSAPRPFASNKHNRKRKSSRRMKQVATHSVGDKSSFESEDDLSRHQHYRSQRPPRAYTGRRNPPPDCVKIYMASDKWRNQEKLINEWKSFMKEKRGDCCKPLGRSASTRHLEQQRISTTRLSVSCRDLSCREHILQPFQLSSSKIMVHPDNLDPWKV